MARYLLDSDALIDYLNARHTAVEFVQRLAFQGDELCVCDVVVAEVYAGLSDVDAEGAAPLLASFEFLPISYETARQAGRWRYSFKRHGITIATTGALVAATAHAHGATVVTANVRDYPMEEVNILPLPRD